MKSQQKLSNPLPKILEFIPSDRFVVIDHDFLDKIFQIWPECYPKINATIIVLLLHLHKNNLVTFHVEPTQYGQIILIKRNIDGVITQ